MSVKRVIASPCCQNTHHHQRQRAHGQNNWHIIWLNFTTGLIRTSLLIDYQLIGNAGIEHDHDVGWQSKQLR